MITTKMKYKRYHNYIGSSKLQRFLTYPIKMIWECINFTAYEHDERYYNSKNLKLDKKEYDNMFLTDGCRRCFIQLRWLGIPIIITLYIILILSTNYYFKTQEDNLRLKNTN